MIKLFTTVRVLLVSGVRYVTLPIRICTHMRTDDGVYIYIDCYTRLYIALRGASIKDKHFPDLINPLPRNKFNCFQVNSAALTSP